MADALDLELRFDPVDRETWREGVEAGLEGVGLEQLDTVLEGGLRVSPLYDEQTAPAGPFGRPGAPPFVRGAAPASGWRLVAALRGEDASALVEAGRLARSIEADSLYLGPTACAQIDREALHALGSPVVLDPGADALAWLAVTSSLEGAELRFDPLGTLARTGELPYSLERGMRWLAELATSGRRVFVDATVHHEAGATCADELGFALATGVAYLRALGAAGHALEDAPRRMTFGFSCDADVFLSAAKLRAARLAWSKVLRATGIDGAEQGMHIHAFESRRPATQLEPLVGALRSTTAGFAAIVGGAQDVTLRAHDASASAARLAINTQHLLRAESHLDRVVDPGGGAYHLEAVTDLFARAAWDRLQQIEAAGGVLELLRSGEVATRHAASAEARRERLRTRELALIGVNRFPSSEDPAPSGETVAAPPVISAERAPKALRDVFREAPREALAAAILEHDVPVEVLRNELTRGDDTVVCAPLARVRDAAAFEALRRRAAALDEPDRLARVLGVGDLKTVKPRVDFAREALQVAGLRVEVSDVTASAPELSSLPPTVVLCTSEPIAPLVAAARSAGARQVLVAGPDEADSGSDGRLYRGMDAVRELGAALSRLEES